ncbi:MAG: hypothetical protein DWQ51_06515 [Microcystis wesenbergii TW10]|uniref:Uncharacterized protein n=1 Tax=Microcystis wesenbergii TW10 TaxID=2060474 RepID=A0A3E0M4F8_9CHRO|nr:MAG: hypothetical protein DWQ51_06515 [Microcystis wesenbergii TW10]
MARKIRAFILKSKISSRAKLISQSRQETGFGRELLRSTKAHAEVRTETGDRRQETGDRRRDQI